MKIRNFCIIAHIDHGKSTLADRFLEITNTIAKQKLSEQFLDAMDLEREKGITIKMHPVRMEYKDCILNLIDTPGHVDFSYEVSRSLLAVEGAILLVDATQGIQAQTLANLDLAKKANLVIIPAINKIDLASAKIQETKEEISLLLDVPAEKIFEVSAKKGTNIEKLLDAIVEQIPSPKTENEKNNIFKALIFDSKYDFYKGVIAYVRVFEGEIKKEENIHLIGTNISGQTKEVGIFQPQLKAVEKLSAGEIGYVATGIKDPTKVRVGDTMTVSGALGITPLEGYHEPQPMVFVSIYPADPADYENLKKAFLQLKLSDASFVFESEAKEFLGRGFKCGFLGTLHAEIISERLKREYGLDLVISSPSVVFKIITKTDKEILAYSPADFLNPSEVKETKEPMVKLKIISPLQYLDRVSQILKNIKAIYLSSEYFGKEKIHLIYQASLRKIITGFYDKLKSVTQGYASLNYEFIGYQNAELVKIEVFINGVKDEAFSKIVDAEDAQNDAKKLALRLKDILPRQLFPVPIQVALHGKVISRETIPALRRDVIAPLYGGDYTRKRKLLERQKRGKKDLKNKTEISIPANVYLEIFREE